MSPTIRIDNEVFDTLKQHAEPFVDTPNTVLRRILQLAPRSEEATVGGETAQPPMQGHRSYKRAASSRSRRKNKHVLRAKAGTTLPDTEYQLPILEILRDSGGRAPTREVIDALGERLDGRLTEIDREPLVSGDIRWRNRAQFVRLYLIERGDMTNDSPRGVWEISDQGRERITASR